MKRFLILLAALALAMSLAAIAGAVEKKEKAADDKKPPIVESKDQKKPAPSADSKKKYDDFVDNNKNGIDDRSESIRPKPVPAKASAAKQAEKKPIVPPAKVDTKKTDSSAKKPK
jgi:hypothetical protein